MDEVSIANGKNLSKNDCIFIGWSKDNLATTNDYYSGQKKKFPSATTLYAVWKNKNLYKVINQKKTWEEANSYCESLGGHLVVITSAEENAYIHHLLAGWANPRCWAGGTDDSLEGNWKWVSGEEWDYTNWISGQPDDNSHNENCLQLAYSVTNGIWDGKWNDADKNIALPFICEWETEKTTTDTSFHNAEWFLVDGDLGVQRRSDWWDSLEEQWQKAFNYKVLGLSEITTKPSDANIQTIFNRTNISVEFYSITNLSGLKHLTNLTYLHCNDNQLTNLNGLENCVNLTSLNYHHNQLSSLTGLENCVKLTWLECYNNQLSSLTGLENCVNLTTLGCYNNQLTNLKGLENCVNLTSLNCRYNQLSSLTGLENCVNLTFLICGSNQLSSLTGLENCVNLTKLYCEHNQLSSLTGLENCVNLDRLYCNDNQLSSLTGLENCVNLNYLSCWGNQLSSLTGIENCANLTSLNCDNNQLSSLTGLENCVNLNTLYCNNNQLSSLTGLENCVNLSSLYCYNNQITAEEVARIKTIVPNCSIDNTNR